MVLKITAIIFDWGGVLSSKSALRDFLKEYAKQHGVNPIELEEKIMNAFQEAKVGKMTSEDFYGVIAKMTKTKPADIHDSFQSFFRSNYDSIELARILKKRYKVALLTNNIGIWIESALHKNKLTDFFDVVISSHSVKMAKPNPEIYHEILRALGVSSAECVFIDDKQKNVDTANSMGMHGITFTSTAQLKRDLEKLGVTTT
ncbi:MAG: HAD family phosphatase [Candidatus Diapherotrites archaeon]